MISLSPEVGISPLEIAVQYFEGGFNIVKDVLYCGGIPFSTVEDI